MGNTLNQYSSCCGRMFEGHAYPRVCACCGNQFWDNPTPVVVVLQPVVDENDQRGLVLIRRSIPPHVGELALPGGFLEHEPWQVGAARELCEEGVVEVDPTTIQPFYLFPMASSHNHKRLLIFTTTSTLSLSQLPPFRENPETSQRVIVWKSTICCFPAHTEAVRSFFER